MEAYGEVDELSGHLGLAQADLPPDLRSLGEVLERVQHELFILGAELATPSGGREGLPRVQKRHVERLEREIDLFTEGLPERKLFVLPRGSVSASRLHVARAVARRTERAVLRLHRLEPVRPEVLEYLNRLSSLLFVMALTANQLAGVAEVAPDYQR